MLSASFALCLSGCGRQESLPAGGADAGKAKTVLTAGVSAGEETWGQDRTASGDKDSGAEADANTNTNTATGPRFPRGSLLQGPAQARGGPGNTGRGTGNGPAQSEWQRRYPKYRLDKAATVRSYAQVSMVPIGVDAFLKTAWTEGQVHVRLALLGPLQNLETFARTQQSVKVTFQDNRGDAIDEVVIPLNQFRQAPSSTNFGTPTLDVEGSIPCALENYERFYQWMFEWQ